MILVCLVLIGMLFALLLWEKHADRQERLKAERKVWDDFYKNEEMMKVMKRENDFYRRLMPPCTMSEGVRHRT
jgi:hypothetical protein